MSQLCQKYDLFVLFYTIVSLNYFILILGLLNQYTNVTIEILICRREIFVKRYLCKFSTLQNVAVVIIIVIQVLLAFVVCIKLVM